MICKLEIGEEACVLKCETIRSPGNCVGGQNRPCASSFRKASTEMVHQNCFTHFFEWKGKCVKVHLVAMKIKNVSLNKSESISNLLLYSNNLTFHLLLFLQNAHRTRLRSMQEISTSSCGCCCVVLSSPSIQPRT